MSRIQKTSILAIATLALGSSALAADGAPSVIRALPHDSRGGVLLEAALVFHDLRGLEARAQARRALLTQTELGRAFYTPESLQKIYGFDLVAELERLLSAIAPEGGEVPAAVAIFSRAEGMGAQLLIRADPAALERLVSPVPVGSWRLFKDGAELKLELAGETFFARLGKDGWLRVAPEASMLISGDGSFALPEPLAARTKDLDTLLYVSGEGALAGELADLFDDQTAKDMLRKVRSAAVGFVRTDDGTDVVRLLVDAPDAVQLGRMVRAPGLANGLAELWGEKASLFLSLSLPPVLMGPGLQALRAAPAEVPEDVVDALAKSDGRLGMVAFGSPGDWAAGLGFVNEAAAETAIGVLQDWLTREFPSFQLSPDEGPKGSSAYRFPGPAGVETPRFARVGRHLLVVNQKGRLRALQGLTQVAAGKAPAPDSLRTPTMAGVLSRPAILLGYGVLGTQGELHDMMAMMVDRALATETGKEVPPAVRGLVEGLPLIITLEGVAASFTYDLAVSLDLEDGVGVLQITSSDL